MWKLGLGVLGTGVAATGGVFVYKELSKSKTISIKDLLSSKNPEKRFISKSSDGSSSEWKKAWKLYMDDYKDNGKNPFSLNQSRPVSSPSGTENASTIFMGKCESISAEKVVDERDDRYRNVLRYCTRDTLVQDLILEGGRTLLKESSDDWSESWKSYRASNIGNADSLDIWKLSDWGNKKGSDSPVSDDLKNKCKEKLESNSGSKGINDYPNVVKWCSRKA